MASSAADIWWQVRAHHEFERCTCRLRRGMTHEQLRKIRSDECGSVDRGRWECGVTSTYRRLVGYPKEDT